jgi:hypothetical protein
LRPRSADECKCMEIQRHKGDGDTGCSFRWLNPGDPGRCIDPSEVCFVPGEDPFSFIATIVLPAWPERYRTEANREKVEAVLRREAPAHVLLRILWVGPRDLCRFETMFRSWQHYLAGKSICGKPFDYCAFVQFFFHHRWEAFADCTSCLPCEAPAVGLPCEPVISAEHYNRKRFLSDTDRLFSWTDPQFLLKQKKLVGKPVLAVAEVGHLPAKPELLAEPVERPQKEVDTVIKKPKRVFVNQRRAARNETAGRLLSELKKLDVAGEVARFLDDTTPVVARLDKICEKLLVKVGSTKGKKPPLNKKHASELLGLVIHHYLDKQVFNGKDPAKIKALSGTLEKAAEAGLDMVQIYRDWQSAEVEKYEAGVPTGLIEQIFLGRSKAS